MSKMGTELGTDASAICIPTELLACIVSQLEDPRPTFQTCKALNSISANPNAFQQWLLNRATAPEYAVLDYTKSQWVKTWTSKQQLVGLRNLVAAIERGNRRSTWYETASATTAMEAFVLRGQTDCARLLRERGVPWSLGGYRTLIPQVARLGMLQTTRFLAEHHPRWTDSVQEAFANAVGQGREDVVQFLLDKGADPTAKQGLSMVLAAWYGQLEMVRLLIKHSGPAIARARNDWALCVSSGRGHLDVTRELLAQGCNPNTLEGTPLAEAASKNCCEVIEVLLASGADIHIRNDSALVMAVMNNQVGAVKLLLARGADVRVCEEEALAEAVDRGHGASVELILEAGVDPNCKDGHAIHRACVRGHSHILEMLTAHGGQVSNPELLLDAACNGRQQVVSMLLGLVQYPSEALDKALVKAASASSANKAAALEVLRQLLAAGANPEAENGHALALAIDAQHQQMAELLLSCGVRVPPTPSSQLLSSAINWGCQPVMRGLTADSHNARAVLKMAAELGALTTIQMCLDTLNSQPGGLDAQDRHVVQRALVAACECGHVPVVQALVGLVRAEDVLPLLQRSRMFGHTKRGMSTRADQVRALQCVLDAARANGAEAPEAMQDAELWLRHHHSRARAQELSALDPRRLRNMSKQEIRAVLAALAEARHRHKHVDGGAAATAAAVGLDAAEPSNPADTDAGPSTSSGAASGGAGNGGSAAHEGAAGPGPRTTAARKQHDMRRERDEWRMQYMLRLMGRRAGLSIRDAEAAWEHLSEDEEFKGGLWASHELSDDATITSESDDDMPGPSSRRTRSRPAHGMLACRVKSSRAVPSGSEPSARTVPASVPAGTGAALEAAGQNGAPSATLQRSGPSAGDNPRAARKRMAMGACLPRMEAADMADTMERAMRPSIPARRGVSDFRAFRQRQLALNAGRCAPPQDITIATPPAAAASGTICVTTTEQLPTAGTAGSSPVAHVEAGTQADVPAVVVGAAGAAQLDALATVAAAAEALRAADQELTHEGVSDDSEDSR